jgi:3',5'-cyclic AMP phosphodiesterase CpdA
VRVALLSDLHENAVAIRDIDLIVPLGDVAEGRPQAHLERWAAMWQR